MLVTGLLIQTVCPSVPVADDKAIVFSGFTVTVTVVGSPAQPVEFVSTTITL